MPYKDKEKQKAYFKEYRKKHMDRHLKGVAARKKNIRDSVIRYKLKPCTDCKKKYPIECMEFDHVRGKKLGCVGTMVGNAVPLEKILEEISKCELVCANCHKIRTARRKQCKLTVEEWHSDDAEEVHIFIEGDQKGSAYVLGYSPSLFTEAEIRALLLENGYVWHGRQDKAKLITAKTKTLEKKWRPKKKPTTKRLGSLRKRTKNKKT